MPTLTEAYPTIARALAEPPGRRAAAPRGADPFPALVGFAASTKGDSRSSLRLTAALEAAHLFDPATLAAADPSEVIDLLREAKVDPPIKTIQVLKRLAAWYQDHRARLEDPDGEFTTSWRDELAAINGISRATADAIALHVFGAATFPVDRPTARILFRHGWIDATTEYEDASRSLVDAADADPVALAAIARGFGDIGKRFCKPASPSCGACPLQSVLPPDGPAPLDE
jgi:endonuclease III